MTNSKEVERLQNTAIEINIGNITNVAENFYIIMDVIYIDLDKAQKYFEVTENNKLGICLLCDWVTTKKTVQFELHTQKPCMSEEDGKGLSEGACTHDGVLVFMITFYTP